MKDFNPFAGLGQFIFSCIVAVLTITMLVGQLIVAKKWCDFMWLMLVFVVLSIIGCKVSWNEYKQDK